MKVNTKTNIIEVEDNEKVIITYKGHNIEIASIGQFEALNIKIPDFSLYASQNSSLVMADLKDSDEIKLSFGVNKQLRLQKFTWDKLFKFAKFEYIYPFVKLENIVNKTLE